MPIFVGVVLDESSPVPVPEGHHTWDHHLSSDVSVLKIRETVMGWEAKCSDTGMKWILDPGFTAMLQDCLHMNITRTLGAPSQDGLRVLLPWLCMCSGHPQFSPEVCRKHHCYLAHRYFISFQNRAC
jgi:hypothetical protein